MRPPVRESLENPRVRDLNQVRAVGSCRVDVHPPARPKAEGEDDALAVG